MTENSRIHPSDHDSTAVNVVNGELVNDDSESSTESEELYMPIDANIGIGTALLFGFQMVMVCSSGIIVAPLIVSNLICASDIGFVRVQLVSTMLFTSGLATLMQILIGIRIPVLQGAAFAFLPTIFIFGNMYPCPGTAPCPDNGTTTMAPNCTISTGHRFSEGDEPEYISRILAIQGSLLSASLMQMIIGGFGLIGVITRYIGPLTIAPLMLCLELSVVEVVLTDMRKSWISLVLVVNNLVACLVFLMLYMAKVSIPMPVYRNRSCSSVKVPFFSIFPYLLAIIIVWLLALVLTLANALSDDARVDTRLNMLMEAPWFRIPYPFQWGPIRFHFGMFLGFAAASIASTIESVGDYFAVARTSLIPAPPEHAVNRGILAEGFCCLMASFFGSGLSLTSYSEVIGVIGITKVASRRMIIGAGFLLMLAGVFSKFGGVVATLPDPLVGGVLCISLAMVGGVGLSSLQLCDLKLSRNAAILGISIMAGVTIPQHFEKIAKEYESDSFDHSTWGNLKDALLTLMQNRMFVAGITGFIMDNSVPGATRKQRGLTDLGVSSESSDHSAYQYPDCVNRVLAKIPFINNLPFLPEIKQT